MNAMTDRHQHASPQWHPTGVQDPQGAALVVSLIDGAWIIGLRDPDLGMIEVERLDTTQVVSVASAVLQIAARVQLPLPGTAPLTERQAARRRLHSLKRLHTLRATTFSQQVAEVELIDDASGEERRHIDGQRRRIDETTTIIRNHELQLSKPSIADAVWELIEQSHPQGNAP